MPTTPRSWSWIVLATLLAAALAPAQAAPAQAAPPAAAWCFARWPATKRPTAAQTRGCAKLFLLRAYACTPDELGGRMDYDPRVPLGMALRYDGEQISRMAGHVARLCGKSKRCDFSKERLLARAAELFMVVGAELWGLLDSGEGGGVGNPIGPALQKIFAGQRLAASEVGGRSLIALIKLRNAPYARHGRPFRSKDLQAFFYGKRKGSQILPRRVDAAYTDKLLTAVDRANIALLGALERKARKGVKRW